MSWRVGEWHRWPIWRHKCKDRATRIISTLRRWRSRDTFSILSGLYGIVVRLYVLYSIVYRYAILCVSFGVFVLFYGFIHILFGAEYTYVHRYHFGAVSTTMLIPTSESAISRDHLPSITFVRLVEKFRDKQTPGNRSNKLTDVTNVALREREAPPATWSPLVTCSLMYKKEKRELLLIVLNI